jgi:hypothetical protein
MKKRMVAAGLLPLGAVFAFFIWSSGPSEQLISPNSQGVLGIESQKNYQRVSTPYMQVDIPVRYVLKSSTPPKEPTFLQQLYGTHVASVSQLSIDQLALTVGSLQNGDITSLSAVQLRQRSPAYRTVDLDVGVEVIAFESLQQHYEVSAFTLNKGSYIAIVQTVQAHDRLTALAEMKHALQSLSWQ